MLSICSVFKISLQFQGYTLHLMAQNIIFVPSPLISTVRIHEPLPILLPSTIGIPCHPWLSQAAFQLLLQWLCCPVSAYLLQLQRPVDRCDICALHPRWLPLFWDSWYTLSRRYHYALVLCVILDFHQLHGLPVECLFDHGFIEIYIVGTCSWTLEIRFITHNYRILVRL